jgi:hypothetical protein
MHKAPYVTTWKDETFRFQYSMMKFKNSLLKYIIELECNAAFPFHLDEATPPACYTRRRRGLIYVGGKGSLTRSFFVVLFEQKILLFSDEELNGNVF